MICEHCLIIPALSWRWPRWALCERQASRQAGRDSPGSGSWVVSLAPPTQEETESPAHGSPAGLRFQPELPPPGMGSPALVVTARLQSRYCPISQMETEAQQWQSPPKAAMGVSVFDPCVTTQGNLAVPARVRKGQRGGLRLLPEGPVASTVPPPLRVRGGRETEAVGGWVGKGAATWWPRIPGKGGWAIAWARLRERRCWQAPGCAQ